MRCFNCGAAAHHEHHVVPRVLGGSSTVWLCAECHDKIHGNGISTPELIKAGIQKAREQGKRLGRPPTLGKSWEAYYMYKAGISSYTIGKAIGAKRVGHLKVYASTYRWLESN